MAAPTNTEFPSLPAALRRSAERHGAACAVIAVDRALTFADVEAQSGQAGAALAARGIRPGDRVGLYAANTADFVVAYFGILKAGAVVVPVNLLLNPREIAYIWQDAGARAVLYGPQFAAAMPAIRPAAPAIEWAVALAGPPAMPGDAAWLDLLAAAGPAPDLALNPADDLAAILYTSGTTGHPKGAMLTHANLACNAASVAQALGLAPGVDRLLTALPLFHAFAATACMIYPLLHGVTTVVLPRFDPQDVARTIARDKITVFLGVPSMYNVLLRLPDECTPLFASLKYGISGGAAMPQEIMAAFERRFGKPIYEGDGPTECSPVTSVNPVGGQRKPLTIGLPVARVNMKILDEAGRACPHGTVGEICVQGPNVMKGYWNRPDDTQAAFFGAWFRTGDLGTEDADGYFAIVDRKKDLVIVNGMNVYPRVVEEVLYQYAPIQEAAVVGEPHELHGEIPVAYVVLKPGATATAAEIKTFCREALGRHEIPRKIFFQTELPKNAAGKILKRALRQHGELERGVDARQPGA